MRSLAATCLVLALLAATGCSGDGAGTTAKPVTTTPTVTPPVRAGHAAPELEALLPDRVSGRKLDKRSATGASVPTGGNPFSRELTTFLASEGKELADLRFANAHARGGKPVVELGVFEVQGVEGDALLRAIVASSRPGAPGLESSTATVSGKRVTRLVYPGGSILYLYARGEDVYYVGTQREDLARTVLAMFP